MYCQQMRLWLVPCCVVYGVIDADYSAFSGLVVTVGVGTPPQLVRLALDFGTSETFLFSRMSRPPFVLESFRMDQSHTYVVMRSEPGSDLTRGFGQQISGSDLVHLDSITERVSVSIPIARVSTSERFCEVAALLGMARNSALTADRSLEIFRDTWATPGKFFVSGTLSDRSPDFTLVTVNDAEWRFHVGLRFNSGATWNTELVVDLSEQDLVLPDAFRAELMEALGPTASVDAGKLTVECSVLGRPRESLMFSLLFPDEEEIHIFSSLLVVASEASFFAYREEFAFCGTRIRFAPASHVVVGRLLLESVARLQFDFSQGRLGLVRSVLNLSRLWMPLSRTPALVPVYGFPVVNRAAPGIEFRITDSAEGFVLVNDSAESNGAALSWRFAKVPAAESIEFSMTQMYGSFANVRLICHSRGIRFEFVRADEGSVQTFRAQLQRTANILSVVLVRNFARLRMNGLALPSRQRWPAGASEACPICLEEMTEGAEVQRLLRCPHEFHYACIRNWLEQGQLTCPQCRAAVDPLPPALTDPPLPNAIREVEVRARGRCVIS